MALNFHFLNDFDKCLECIIEQIFETSWNGFNFIVGLNFELAIN
jgi:hypothetical protein